jgi:hypothetical protein
MVELLGILLALMLLWLGLLVRRGWRAMRRYLGPVAGRPLRLSRSIRRHQAERLETLGAELARTRRLLRTVERERDALRAGAAGPQSRFQRAKRAFALHFHPDRLRTHPEGRIRRRIFQEFWPILQRIERS